MRQQTRDNRQIRFHTRGFTLVELMVTIAIFITVITVATGALFSAQAVNVHLEQSQIILDEVNVAMELMVRDVRYGTTFYCDTTLPSPVPTMRKSCAYPNGGGVLIFRPAVSLVGSTNPLNDRVAYYVSNGVLYKNEYPSGGDMTTSQLTSSSVNVSSLTFFTVGANSKSGTNDFSSRSDNNQPLVTIVLSGVTVPLKKNTLPVSFSIQSSASARDIDN